LNKGPTLVQILWIPLRSLQALYHHRTQKIETNTHSQKRICMHNLGVKQLMSFSIHHHVASGINILMRIPSVKFNQNLLTKGSSATNTRSDMTNVTFL
jgi:hypothetical protein